MQKCILRGRSQNIWETAKREFTKVTQRCARKNVNESKLSLYFLKFGFSGLGITAVCILKSSNQFVFCKEAKRISDINPISLSDPELNFEWTKFFQYLYPHIWYLLLALSVSIYKCAKIIDKFDILLQITYWQFVLIECINSCTVKYTNTTVRWKCYKRTNGNMSEQK